MATLTHAQIDDFVEATLPNIRRDTWADISQTLQSYTWASRWFKSKEKPERGGPYLEWKLRVANQGSAKHSGLYAVVNTTKRNVLTHARTAWSKQEVSYIYDIDEDAFNSGPERLIREMDLNEQGLVNDIVALMETSMWTAPAASTADPMPPCGIPFWVQQNATLGFNGGDPSGWTTGAGGIATATYPNWSNYSGTYSQVTRDDLVEKVVNACDYCYFEAPASFPELAGGPSDWGFYTVHSVLAAFRRALQAGNDNLGNDVAKWAGEVVIRGNPVTWVPAISNSDSDAYDSHAPFYGINWRTMEYYFKSDRHMVKLPPYPAPNQPTVRVRVMHNWGNFLCYDRRRNFVFYAA